MVEPNRRQICIPGYAWSVKYFVLENKVKRNKAIRFTLEFVEQYFYDQRAPFDFIYHHEKLFQSASPNGQILRNL